MVFVKGAWIEDRRFPFDPRYHEYFCCPKGQVTAWMINGEEFTTCGLAPTGKVSVIDGYEYHHQRRLERHPEIQHATRPDWCPLRKMLQE
jgi:hypothetical protein